jgi:hypothetical protein
MKSVSMVPLHCFSSHWYSASLISLAGGGAQTLLSETKASSVGATDSNQAETSENLVTLGSQLISLPGPMST